MKLILKILMIISIIIIYKPEELVNNILVLLDDLQNATGIEPEKLNDQYEKLFSILNGLLSQVDNKSLLMINVY